jgi:DNA-binding beta-propeller fold protein YncE
LKISSSRKCTLIVGTGEKGFDGDGFPAIQAKLNEPKGLVIVNDEYLYVADSGNNRIRKIDLKMGIITTVAGNGKAELSGDNGIAAQAGLNHPRGLVIDQSGNLLIADTGNNRIRKVEFRTGLITSLAGAEPEEWDPKLKNWHPKSEAEAELHEMKKMFFSNTIGDGRLATHALLSEPTNLAVDNKGNISFCRTRALPNPHYQTQEWEN